MKVVKFGGSSVANAKQILKIIEIVRSDLDRKIVVVSAPGKRFRDDKKVTDLLINLAKRVIEGNSYSNELELIIDRYSSIQQEIGLSQDIITEIKDDLEFRILNRVPDNAQFLDTMKASGEDNNAKLIALAFKHLDIPARYLCPGDAGLLLSNDFGNAKVLTKSYKNLEKLRCSSDVIIFPGFFGKTITGEVATFPRGGSDITGAILAAAVKADVYENFTDVDSVYAMDPRLVNNSPAIDRMTYREMRELAYAGFGVFHDEAIVPAVQAGIPISIKNTNMPDAVGTQILPTREISQQEVIGISSADGFSAIYIDKYMMNREIGFGRKLLEILEKKKVSYEHIPSGIDNMSVILHSNQLDGKEDDIIKIIRSELYPDSINVEHGLALIMVVGEGMRFAVGMAAKATQALANAGVNIEMVNQGASEISMMFAVKADDRKKALNSLAEIFFK